MKRTSIALLTVGALFAAACADDEGSAPPPDDAVPDDTTTSSTTTLVPPPPTDPPEVPTPMIGDLVLPCGALDAAALAEEPGIDGESITIGTGNDRGGVATVNAGRGLTEAVSALADHCNALGGIAARDIVVIDYDAAGVETAARIEAACAQVVAMVGFRYLDAATAETTAAGCGLPLVAADQLLAARPVRLHAHYAALFAAPLEAGSVAVVGPDTTAAAVARLRRTVALTAGDSPFAVSADLAYPIDAPPDWSRLVGEARASGAGAVHIDGGCDHAVIPFLEVAAAAGWDPVVIATASAYDDACLDQPDLVRRLLVELPFLPFEDGAEAPVTAAHLEIFDRTGAPRSGDALLAASAFWRWLIAAGECGADANRRCIADAAAALDGWSAGGLHPPVGADGTTEPCAVIIGVDSGVWIRRLPAEAGAYECNAAWSVDV